MNTSPLSERAMLASLNIRRWQAARTDKKITSEVAVQHSVKEKRAGKFRKNAIDVEAASFVAVGTAASDLRTKHYFCTLPWSQDGSRILPSAMFVEYSEEMRKLRGAFDRAVKAFIDDYPTLKSAARLELNGMYNEQDYPDNISAKFGLDIVIMPLPDSQDFRACLSESAVAEIKEGIAAELKHSMNVAMRDPYERLYSHISRMVARLSDRKAVFRDTLITGLADLCAILPGLNLTSDPKLDELRKRAETMIVGVDPRDLREVPSVRRDVARQAAEIQNMMASFMGATPPAEAK